MIEEIKARQERDKEILLKEHMERVRAIEEQAMKAEKIREPVDEPREDFIELADK